MAPTTTTSVRTPPPRQLLNMETLESLTHWKTSFRTFYKKDPDYKIFFKPNMQWNANAQNYGLLDEADGAKRKAIELSEDLVDLLTTLAGYLPHSYLTDKILKSTENWDQVFGIIFEHYNVQITSESIFWIGNLFLSSLMKPTVSSMNVFYSILSSILLPQVLKWRI